MQNISKGEKVIVYGFFALSDLVQIILDILVVSEVVNHILDFIIGGILLAYGQWRKLWNGNKLLILLATFVGEQIPFVNAAPFWTIDVWNMYSGRAPQVDTEKVKYLNKDGVRLPSGKTSPLYQKGIRLNK